MKRVEVSVGEGYARWAAAYDAYENPLVAVEEPVVRAMLTPVDGRVVLDAGCGTGRHAIWMRDAGAHVIGVDESEAMLAIARGKAPDLDLRLGKLDALDFAPGTFDIVLNALVAEHVDDLRAMLASFQRVVRTVGTLVLSVFHPFMILKGVPTHFEDDASDTEFVLPSRSHLVSDYVRALRDTGFRLEDMREPIVDESLIARMPHMSKHRGVPLALVVRAKKL